MSESAIGRSANIAGLSLMTGLFGVAYYPAVLALIDSWSTNQTYSHGFVVPLVSAALIWIQRDRLRQTAVSPSLWWGTAVSVAALSMLVLGRVSSVMLLEQLALLVTICGLVLLLFGSRMLWALAFPLGYLLAMIPHWDMFTAGLHPPFQHYSAIIGAGALRLLGFPVFKDGVLLYLPNITLEVAEACSGVNNLIAILAIGLPMTYLSVRRWWRRGAILAAAALIALLSNGARVAIVCLFAYFGIRGADGDIHGPFALLRTMLISGVGFVALFWLISRFGDDDAASEAPAVAGVGSDQLAPVGKPRWLCLQPAPLLIAIAVLASSATVGAWQDVPNVPSQTDLDAFPRRLGEWQWNGRDVSSPLDSLNFDHAVSRRYTALERPVVDLFVGYYGRQTHDSELGGYRMREALLPPAAPSARFRVNDASIRHLVADRGTHREYVAYWYVLNGRIVTEDYEAKLHTAWNTLTSRQSAGTLVVVTMKQHAEEPMEASRRRVQPFIAEVLKQF